MLFKLYSNTLTCIPCRMLQMELNRVFPDWRQHIQYIDISNPTKQDLELIKQEKIKTLPSFTQGGEIKFTGFKTDIAKKIKDLCILE